MRVRLWGSYLVRHGSGDVGAVDCGFIFVGSRTRGSRFPSALRLTCIHVIWPITAGCWGNGGIPVKKHWKLQYNLKCGTIWVDNTVSKVGGGRARFPPETLRVWVGGKIVGEPCLQCRQPGFCQIWSNVNAWDLVSNVSQSIVEITNPSDLGTSVPRSRNLSRSPIYAVEHSFRLLELIWRKRRVHQTRWINTLIKAHFGLPWPWAHCRNFEILNKSLDSLESGMSRDYVNTSKRWNVRTGLENGCKIWWISDWHGAMCRYKEVRIEGRRTIYVVELGDFWTIRAIPASRPDLTGITSSSSQHAKPITKQQMSQYPFY